MNIQGGSGTYRLITLITAFFSEGLLEMPGEVSVPREEVGLVS